MPNMTISLKERLPLKPCMILGVGSVGLDYITTKLLPAEGIARLQPNTSFRVNDERGKEVCIFNGPFLTDGHKLPGHSLTIGDKHRTGNGKPSHIQEFTLGKDIEKRIGGGIANLGRALIHYNNQIPFGLMTLRGEHDLDELVEGAYYQCIPVPGQADQKNLVLRTEYNRTIIRGKPLHYTPKNYRFHPEFEFNIGSLVIDSLSSNVLTQAAIDYYRQECSAHDRMRGIIALTPSMNHSYQYISKEAIPHGFIPIFGPLDLLRYVSRGMKNASEKAEEDITYHDIIEALQYVRKEQNGASNSVSCSYHQRMYVTLGAFGSMGVGTNGSTYRVDILPAEGDHFNGAGDVYAAIVTHYEHLRFIRPDEPRAVYEIMAYASAASALHISGKRPYLAAVSQKLKKHAHVHYETLGNIDTLDPECALFKRKLTEVGNHPVTGTYSTMKFGE